jgi:hypothetical protein
VQEGRGLFILAAPPHLRPATTTAAADATPLRSSVPRPPPPANQLHRIDPPAPRPPSPDHGPREGPHCRLRLPRFRAGKDVPEPAIRGVEGWQQMSVEGRQVQWQRKTVRATNERRRASTKVAKKDSEAQVYTEKKGMKSRISAGCE